MQEIVGRTMVSAGTKNIIAGFVAVVAIAMAVIIAVEGIRYGPRPLPKLEWPEPLKNVRLVPEIPVLADDEVTRTNAFYYLRELGEVASFTRPGENEYLETTRFFESGYQRGEFPELANLYARSIDAVRASYQAAETEDCQVATKLTRNEPTQYLRGTEKVGRLLVFEAERNALNQNWDDARRDYRAALRIANQVTRGGTLANYSTAIMVTAEACRSLRRVVLANIPPQQFFTDLIAELQTVEASLVPPAEVFRFEYLVAFNELRQFYEREVEQLPEQYQSFADLEKYLDGVFSYIIAFMQREYEPSRYKRYVGAMLAAIHGERSSFDTGIRDPLAMEMVRQAIPYFGDFRRDYLLHVVNLRGTRGVLQVQLYQLTNDGRLPETLAEVMAAASANAGAGLADPFDPSGQTFRFFSHPATGTWNLYSVGPDREDNGGANGSILSGYHPEYYLSPDVCFSSTEFEL
jgi:hypothetical protein